MCPSSAAGDCCQKTPHDDGRMVAHVRLVLNSQLALMDATTLSSLQQQLIVERVSHKLLTHYGAFDSFASELPSVRQSRSKRVQRLLSKYLDAEAGHRAGATR